MKLGRNSQKFSTWPTVILQILSHIGTSSGRRTQGNMDSSDSKYHRIIKGGGCFLWVLDASIVLHFYTLPDPQNCWILIEVTDEKDRGQFWKIISVLRWLQSYWLEIKTNCASGGAWTVADAKAVFSGPARGSGNRLGRCAVNYCDGNLRMRANDPLSCRLPFLIFNPMYWRDIEQ